MIFEALAAPIVAIGMHMGTIHSTDNFNDFNPGLYAKNEAGVTVGSFYNSERRQSFYGGWTWSPHKNFDITFGGITGYKAATVQPLVLPTVHFEVAKDVRARIGYVPKFHTNGAHAVHFMLEYRFK